MFQAAQSLQREFTLCSSLDPALDLPDVEELPDDAPAADVEAREARIKARDTKLRVARQTGKWHEIVKPGQTPTLFKFRSLHGAPESWLRGQIARDELEGGEGLELAFRLALVEITNFPKLKLEHEYIGKQRLATVESISPRYDVGGDEKPWLGKLIIKELGSLVVARAVRGVDPLL